jgi:hypothetical protein
MKTTTSNDKATGLRVAAWCLVWGYAVLLGTFMIRHPVALTVMIPLGGALVALGIVLWLRAVVAEARSKDMV